LDLEEDPTVCCLQEMHLTGKGKHRLEVTGWKKEENRAKIPIIFSNTEDFK
jgi:hypothetical protein